MVSTHPSHLTKLKATPTTDNFNLNRSPRPSGECSVVDRSVEAPEHNVSQWANDASQLAFDPTNEIVPPSKKNPSDIDVTSSG